MYINGKLQPYCVCMENIFKRFTTVCPPQKFPQVTPLCEYNCQLSPYPDVLLNLIFCPKNKTKTQKPKTKNEN